MKAQLIDPAIGLLEAVSEYGGVNAAADVLGRNASGISRQIQRLADDLGVPLLRRRGRAVELTGAARALVREAPHLHAADERVRAALVEATDPQAGEIRVAAHVLAISSIVVPALRRWTQQRPAASWNIRESEPFNAQRLLTSRAADLVIMPAGSHAPASDHPRFSVHRLVVEPVDIIVPRGHPLATREDEVTLQEAADDPWIFGSVGQGSRQEILEHCSKAGFTPAERHHAQDWTSVSTLVAAGLGVSLLPRMAPIHPGVVRVTLSGPTAPVRSLLMVLRRGNERRTLLRETMEILESTAVQALTTQQTLAGMSS
ncbi:LysR family transcriptional regulator [Nesterenkonia sp. MY13]|uniref:LysR family transcriptional regulator n=1 Tax=Nesterenkonia sedimenti TaxID=1463632 RepID=A0A7X8TLM0_9MICC|nr:LysR family transcriptional regulator [Nesterenkonia sedimenti]NLS10860.1 LysR family transcriptional regulator [Nesterenkonia sedimenti]